MDGFGDDRMPDMCRLFGVADPLIVRIHGYARREIVTAAAVFFADVTYP